MKIIYVGKKDRATSQSRKENINRQEDMQLFFIEK